MLSTIVQALAGVLAAVLSAAAGVLTPYLIKLVQERMLKSMNDRLGAAAETVAAEMATAVGSAIQTQIETGVETLRQRLPDAVAKLSPSDETLAALIKKAQVKMAAPTVVVPAANQ